MTTVGLMVEVHALLSNKAEQSLAGTIKQHLSTLVSQGHMLQNKFFEGLPEVILNPTATPRCKERNSHSQ